MKTVEEKQSKMESEIYSIKTGQENRIITNTNNSNTIPTDKNDQVIVIKGNSKVTIQQNEEENKIEYNKSSRLKENNLLASIYFNFNSSLIQLQEKYRMKKIISKFRSSKSILLVGHSDWIGTKEYNYKLSRKRAEAVKRELRNLVGSENIQISNGDSLEYKRGNAKLSESTASWHRRVDIFLVDN